MCELCTANLKLEHSAANSASDGARSALLQDADLSKPTSAKAEQQATDQAPTSTSIGDVKTKHETPGETDKSTTDAKKLLLDKYGVQVREVDGQNEFFYRAGGQDNIVLRTAADQASLDKAPEQLDQIVRQKVESIENTFKVRFAKPGEFATYQELQDENCKPIQGEKVLARQATLPVLYGIEAGLKQSQPSQFITGGKEGVKIFLLDKQAAPDFYGGRKIQGTFRFLGQDGKPEIFLTPAGQDQPATAKDTLKPGDRNVAWITTHEVSHNSQSLQWHNQTPDSEAQKMGWEKYVHSSGKTIYPFIQGKNGELFANASDSCKVPTTWFSIHKSGWPLNENGLPVQRVADAAKFTNEQVMDKAQIRPSTFYFSSPYEEMAEAITSFRFSPESRAALYKNSPTLYEMTKEYDSKELTGFYGKDWHWNSKMVRTPDGKVVPRTDESVATIDRFEKMIRSAN